MKNETWSGGASGGVIERERVVTTDQGDHDRFAHIVAHHEKGRAEAKVTEAIINGTPLKALCGKVWVPSRDAKRFPVCPECKEIKDEILARSNQ